MKRTIIAALAALLVVVGLTACGGPERSSAIKHDERTINNQLGELEQVEPIPRLHDSADRKIQAEFYTAEADPNKIWYLAVLSYSGSIEATYTIRGPVEPAGDEVTNPQQIACSGHENDSCITLALAEPNGIYQHDTNDHLAVLTDGALLRFEGNYQVSDQPFSVHTPVSIGINGSAPVSSTDLSKTTGGVLPPRG